MSLSFQSIEVRTDCTKGQDTVAVKRVVANIASPDTGKAKSFYGDVLGMDLAMDHGWIVTFAGERGAMAQVSIAAEGGAGTPVPDFSVEVDNLEEVLERVRAQGLVIEYGPVDEDWGVRRFYVRDPFGRLVNILQHA
jgi:catechol 2,3-dioxygenase-like lactoylglutathione lyase family enzyme